MLSIDVLVVAHDEGMRAMLCRSVSAQQALNVCGCCGDAAEAERLAREYPPDVIALDMQLPGTDCRALIGRLRAACGAAVVAMSAVTGIALETLNAGAADFVYMPERGSNSDNGRFLADAVERVKIAAALHGKRRNVLAPELSSRPAEVVTVAGAAGGPVPLALLASRLPQNGPAILAVQWQARAFCGDYCAVLSGMAGRNAVAGADGMEIAPGGLYVVAGNRRVGLSHKNGRMVLRVRGVCRSRDEQAKALFASAAAIDGPAAGVLLYESAAGLAALKRLASRGKRAVKLNKNEILRDIGYRAGGGVLELPLEDIASATLS